MKGSNGPVEPSAASREFAHTVAQMVTALEEQGFSHHEAIGITLHTMNPGAS